MNDIEHQIELKIRAFAQELNALIRAAALDAVSQALTGGRTLRTAAGRVADGRSNKRTEEQLAAIGAEVERYVANNPGLGIEKIAQGLETLTSELVLPINKLIQGKRLRREGQRRASKYFVAGAANSGKSSKKRGKKSA